MNDRGYTCWKIPEENQSKLLVNLLGENYYFSRIIIEENWKLHLDHVTEDFDCAVDGRFISNRKAIILLGDLIITENVICMPAAIMLSPLSTPTYIRPDRNFYHLTVATRGKGRPKDSNAIIEHYHDSSRIVSFDTWVAVGYYAYVPFEREKPDVAN